MFVILVLLLMAGICVGATDPMNAGPYTVGSQVVSVPGTSGGNLSTDLYFPGSPATGVDASAAPCPAIVLGHGFSGSKAQHSNQGKHLASRGFIVLIPNFNGGSDHARNALDLRKCLDWIIERNGDASSSFFGRVRMDRLGVSGYSAGGLSAIIAASQDNRIGAISLLDPVDSGGQGVAALASVSAPIAITYSEGSSCNANASAVTLYNTARGLKRGMRIVGANHTDPQDPAGFLGILVCGSPNSTRQALYRRYLTGWFEYFLHEDTTYAPWVFNYPGGQVEADLQAGQVTYDAPAAPLKLSGSKVHGNFILEVMGPPSQRFAVDISTNALVWNPSFTNQLAPSGTFVTNDPGPGPKLFRTRSLP